MSIESALVTHLKTDSILSGLSIGIYPHVAPIDSSYPFINYEILGSDIESYINTGASLTLTEHTIDLSVYTDSVSQRETITTRVKNILHGFRGALGTENFDIRKSVLQSFSTFSESDLTGTDEQIYRAHMSFLIFFNWS